MKNLKILCAILAITSIFITLVRCSTEETEAPIEASPYVIMTSEEFSEFRSASQDLFNTHKFVIDSMVNENRSELSAMCKSISDDTKSYDYLQEYKIRGIFSKEEYSKLTESVEKLKLAGERLLAVYRIEKMSQADLELLFTNLIYIEKPHFTYPDTKSMSCVINCINSMNRAVESAQRQFDFTCASIGLGAVIAGATGGPFGLFAGGIGGVGLGILAYGVYVGDLNDAVNNNNACIAGC